MRIQKKYGRAATAAVILKSGAILTGVLVMTAAASPLLRQMEWWHDAPFAYSLHDIAQAMHDPLLYLEERSPGLRDSRGLLQSKGARQAMINTSRRHGPPGAPEERVLANVLGPYAVPAMMDDLVPRGQTPDIAERSFASGPGSTGGGANGLTPQSAPPSAPSILNGAAATPVVTPAAVPEASSWIMLLWGFLMTGFAVRFSKRVRSGELHLRPER